MGCELEKGEERWRSQAQTRGASEQAERSSDRSVAKGSGRLEVKHSRIASDDEKSA